MLPPRIARVLTSIPCDVADKLQEIRLRAGCQPMLRCRDSAFFISQNGLSDTSDNSLLLGMREMSEIFSAICGYSVYSKQKELVNGYVTLRGGCRAGICGTAVSDGGKLSNIRDISSINIRIASEIKGCSEEILKVLNPMNGVLICGAPCSGKTTLLRDIARVLSGRACVSLIDSRGELAGTVAGERQFDVGLCDVLDGYDRRSGFEHAVRCLSPDIIICDELGADDFDSVSLAASSGVSVIASSHCPGLPEFKNRPKLLRLLESSAFGHVVFLGSRSEAGTIKRVILSDEFFG